MRVKRGTVRRHRHKKVINMVKGQWGTRGRLFKRSNEAMMKSYWYAYRDRRARRRDLRRLWITRINAASRANGLPYSKFIHGLKLANYADTSGNPTAAKVYRCARLILSQPGLEGYCLLGAVIASQDQWHHAHGLVKAFREELADRPGFPVVILIAGNKEAEALEILREGLKDLPIHLELYGREYIHKLDFVAERMKALVEEYRTRTS